MTEKRPFADLPCTPATHFRLYFYAAVSQVLAAVAARAEASELVNDCVRALSGYADELRACGVPDLPAPEALVWWARAIAAWEATVAEFLPARALRSAIGAAHEDILLVFVAGLIEEDARFGSLFELMNAAHGQAGRTCACLCASSPTVASCGSSMPRRRAFSMGSKSPPASGMPFAANGTRARCLGFGTSRRVCCRSGTT
jgi:hypothetical protein